MYEDPLNEDQKEELKWVMKAAMIGNVRRRSLAVWARENWDTFSTLLKV